MDERHFRSMKEIMERYFPRKVELKKIEVETPKEFGERIVAGIIGSAYAGIMTNLVCGERDEV